MNNGDKSKKGNKTLKDLEADLNHYVKFIDECVSSVSDSEYSMSFSIRGKDSTYEDIQSLDLSERYDIAIKLINDDDFFNSSDVNSNELHKAIRVLYILGFRDLSKAVHKISVDYSITKHFQPKIDDIKAKIKHKKITSKGGKGRTSKHKETALKIASDTWEEIPCASMSSMAQKIWIYLSKKRGDVPEKETIEKWLKESGLNPNQQPKIRNYELIV